MYQRLTFILSFICFFTQAQEVQWAKKVMGFSSERTDMSQSPAYRAIQILGKPNKLPQKGESVCAWSPANADSFGEEWIKVSFNKPLITKQIAIAENFGAGAITQIIAYDSTDCAYLVYENKEPIPKEIGRLWNIIIPPTTYPVFALKIILEPFKIKGYNQIDAIAISDSDSPIETPIKQASNLPKVLEKENLGRNVNSKFGEIAPVISPDGKTLFFTREGYPDNLGKEKLQDIWYSKLQSDGTWNLAENLKDLNDDLNNAVATISADGKKIYVLNVYLPNGVVKKGLSSSSRNKIGGWGKRQELKIKNYDSESDTNEFSISSDGKTLVLSGKNKNTFGDKDLYVSFKNEDDTWTKPLNLGNVINTADREECPTIAADSKTLYFTSEGHPGYGGGDIFMSKRLDSTWTNWSEPENLGPLINTHTWDGYLTIPASGDYAYMASEFNSIGKGDIFRFKMFPSIKPEPVAIITGIVSNALDNKPLAADVLIEVLNDSASHEKQLADFDPDTGEFKLILPLKKIYSLNASKKDFLSISEIIYLQKESKFREIHKNISLVPIKEGSKIVLHNLFFEQSKYEIQAISYPELNRIIDVMTEHPMMEVLLEGHTDNQGEMLLNLKLSEDRVAEVKKYLVEQGCIDEKRIQLKGWGQTHALVSNATEETRKKNRRVEFTIIKI